MKRRGSSMVEFALAAPVLLLLLAGVLNYAAALRAGIAVSDAARAGAEYGSLTPTNASDQAGIAAAVRNAAPALGGISVVSAKSCKCAGGSAVNCSGTCPDGPVEIYVQVTAAAAAPAWFRYAGLGYTGAVGAAATMRVR